MKPRLSDRRPLSAFFLKLLHRPRLSLRLKLALVFGLPMFTLVVVLSFNNFARIRTSLNRQVESTSVQLADVILSVLDDAMLKNDRDEMRAILGSIGGGDSSIARVWLLDLDGVVREANQPQEIGLRADTTAMGCSECHQQPAGTRPRVNALTSHEGMLRVITPIKNRAECQACHSPAEPHLGILLIDTSLTGAQEQILDGQRRDLALTLVVIVLGVLATLETVKLLVVRRVEVIHKTLALFQKGDFTARIPATWRTHDELTLLAEDINHMADALTRQQQEQTERAQMRGQAILEERERIARELHDGVAQFLGYINTKVIAARLQLNSSQAEAADRSLGQIEQAVREQSLDVRSSIVGLKMDGFASAGLACGLRGYIGQFSRITDFSVEVDIPPELDALKLNPETELHLLRIAQEALSNVRKHAEARSARVRMAREGGSLELSVHDDGVGFNPWVWNAAQSARFGLQTMRERAGMIGADFSIYSEPGCGTTVSLRLNLIEDVSVVQ